MAIARQWSQQDLYGPILDGAALRHGIPPELLNGLAAVESGFNAGAVSSSGARGLLQLEPATAAGLGYSGTAAGLADPTINAELGAELLRQFLDQLGQDPARAVSAYNGGNRPALGFGTPLTQPLRLCQRWNSDRSNCLQWYQAAAGEFGNQPYVDDVLEARDYFAAYLPEQGRAIAAAGFSGWIPAVILVGIVIGGIRRPGRRHSRGERG